jgi:two-component system, chemotaxis family, response regulator Rcp1
MANNDLVDILLIEDNAGDVKLITDALAETEKHPSFNVVRDGMEAMQFLKHEGTFQNAPRPQIIMLDLNLPRKDGREVLNEIKSDPSLRLIPVIVFSSSDAPLDIYNCYALCANCYLVKPRDLFSLIDTINSLVEFWLTKVSLPRGT